MDPMTPNSHSSRLTMEPAEAPPVGYRFERAFQHMHDFHMMFVQDIADNWGYLRHAVTVLRDQVAWIRASEEVVLNEEGKEKWRMVKHHEHLEALQDFNQAVERVTGADMFLDYVKEMRDGKWGTEFEAPAVEMCALLHDAKQMLPKRFPRQFGEVHPLVSK